MTDNSTDEFDKDRHYRRQEVRPARATEPAFYGGPLDGSFDFTRPVDDELTYQPTGGSIHHYERDITGKMCYTGLVDPHNNDAQADGA